MKRALVKILRSGKIGSKDYISVVFSFSLLKDVRELSWMSNGVMRF